MKLIKYDPPSPKNNLPKKLNRYITDNMTIAVKIKSVFKFKLYLIYCADIHYIMKVLTLYIRQ